MEKIVHEAVKEAILTGYDHGQVDIGMVMRGAHLVNSWSDDDRRRVLDAMELRIHTLRNGIIRESWKKMLGERAALAPIP